MLQGDDRTSVESAKFERDRFIDTVVKTSVVKYTQSEMTLIASLSEHSVGGIEDKRNILFQNSVTMSLIS